MILKSNLPAYIWLTSIFLRFTLCSFLTKQRAWNRYPEFCFYLAFSTLLSCALFLSSTFSLPGLYAVIWAFGSAIQQISAVTVAGSCYRSLFVRRTMPCGFNERLFAPLFLVSVFAVSIASALKSQSTHWISMELSALRSVSILLAGVFWILSLLSDRYGIPWRTRQFGIGLGFLFQYSAAIAIDGIAAGGGLLERRLAGVLGLCTTIVATLTWSKFFLKDEAPLLMIAPKELAAISEISHSFKKSVQSIRVDCRQRRAR